MMPRFLIHASRSLAFATISLLFASSSFAGRCETGKGITSNDILGLAGSSDMLWMLTDIYALNSINGEDGSISERVKQNQNWWSYTLGCTNAPVRDIAFGGATAVVCFDSTDNKPGHIMTFKYEPGLINQSDLSFPWSFDLLKDSSLFVPADVAWCNGSFYFACLKRGLVKWNPENGKIRVFSPGSDSGLSVEDYSGSPEEVISAENAGDKLVVTTPSKIWVYNTSESSWDSTVTSSIMDKGVTLEKFVAAFGNAHASGTPLYSLASVKQSESLVLLKYSRLDNKWGIMLDRAPSGISFAADNYIYMTFEPNVIRAYRDTLGDSGIVRNPAPAINHSKFQPRMTNIIDGIDYPGQIYDILYVPSTDTSGLLWIASSEGLFLAENEVPEKSKGKLVLIRRAPPVRAGLKQTYARPGILTTDGGESRTEFIYNLSADAKVTIKVYDYNMDLVKIVINNKPRKAGKNGGPEGRSTVINEDYWDGKAPGGRKCAPGVYYYKITTNTGDRAFGKIVVAK